VISPAENTVYTPYTYGSGQPYKCVKDEIALVQVTDTADTVGGGHRFAGDLSLCTDCGSGVRYCEGRGGRGRPVGLCLSGASCWTLC